MFSFLFIAVNFTLILLVILISNYWLEFILIFYVYDKKFYIIYAVWFIYRIWVLIVFLIHPFKASFFLSKENGIVAPSPPMIIFSAVFIGFHIAHEWDQLFGSLLQSETITWAFVFSPYIIRGGCSIPYSLDITRGSSLLVKHCTADVWLTPDTPGTP